MAINCNSVKIARDFFRLGNFKEFGVERLEQLSNKMKQKLDFVELGITNGEFFHGVTPKSLAEFKTKKIAKLTIFDDLYKHPGNSKMNTHTIGLVLNKKTNNFFYRQRDEIIILDSLTGLSPKVDEIHNKIIKGFINKHFPDAKVIINKETQQAKGTLTCLNWTFANLEAAKKNLGTTSILNKLPKAKDIDAIMQSQKRMVIS